MADVFNRDEKEAGLARAISKELNRARLELIAIIPELDNFMRDVEPAFWTTHSTNLERAIAPILTSVALNQAETMLGEFEFLGVEWGLVNQAAADWARQYTFELVKGLTDTSKQTLQKLIAQFFEQGMNQGELRDALAPIFGPLRAEIIARTEVTRAASEGEQLWAKQIAEQGIQMQPVWNTRMDELVCPICGPKANKPIMDEQYPPAHPRCRCWVGYELPKE